MCLSKAASHFAAESEDESENVIADVGVAHRRADILVAEEAPGSLANPFPSD